MLPPAQPLPLLLMLPLYPLLQPLPQHLPHPLYLLLSARSSNHHRRVPLSSHPSNPAPRTSCRPRIFLHCHLLHHPSKTLDSLYTSALHPLPPFFFFFCYVFLLCSNSNIPHTNQENKHKSALISAANNKHAFFSYSRRFKPLTLFYQTFILTEDVGSMSLHM